MKLTFREFVQPLRWIDGRPMASVIEPYRWRIFDRAFQRVGLLAFAYSLIVCGRAKKNWKTADLVVATLFSLMDNSPGGNQVYVVANDEGQAADDLALAKKIVRANPVLDKRLKLKANVIERCDGAGFIEVLPAQDAIGAHGKTYRLLAIDEIHGYRNWDLLEALAPDPTRPDCQTWITSYASIFHRPGAPLFDLLARAKAGTDPRMLVSWHAADWCTDPEFAELPPEQRANPSMLSWGNPEYLSQQQRRLPAHKYRRLHLNLPGLPEGSAFQPEPVMNAVARGMTVWLRVDALRTLAAFVDMSGGSSDDAVLCVAGLDAEGCFVVVRLVDQGAPPPFDPRKAIERFVPVLAEYGISRVTGDRYAGETFRRDFESHGIAYDVSPWTKSQLYEALEPRLNSGQVILPDVPLLEQQLLALVWRGGKINHQAGEHDDYANTAAGAVQVLAGPRHGLIVIMPLKGI